MSGRLSERTYLVLLALAERPLHGYGIVNEVRTLSDDAVRLGPGTLYALLDRMASSGLIVADREEVVDGRLRRYYRITDEGAAAVTAETARIQALAVRARAVLRAAPSAGIA